MPVGIFRRVIGGECFDLFPGHRYDTLALALCGNLVDVDIVEPGMVFCVDIGIYCEEWGIGFRLEDNCLVTEDSCENLTASIPRTIEEIESVMGGE